MIPPSRDGLNRLAVEAYSTLAASHYEDPVNQAFLYGALTRRFVREVGFRPRDRRVLDLGCGTGVVFTLLEEAFQRLDLEGIGLDPASGMLDIARRKFRGKGRFRFVQGAFEGIPLASGSVDRILSTLALHWAGSPQRAVAEMGRVLRPHGRLEILMSAAEDGQAFRRAVHRALRRHLDYARLRRSAQAMQRISLQECEALFAPLEGRFRVEVEERREVVYGSVEEHLKWWLARAVPVVAELGAGAREGFLEALRRELQGMADGARGVPFDSVQLVIRAEGRGE